MCIRDRLYTAPIRFQYDLVINLVAITMDTLSVGSVIVILVTSTYRRIVFKMFIVSLDDSDHVTVITLAVLVPFRFSYVARA